MFGMVRYIIRTIQNCAIMNLHFQHEYSDWALTVQNLAFSYQETGFRLFVPQLNIRRGERVGLIGASGSGRTTLAHLMAGILRPRSGTLVLLGRDLAVLGEAERRELRIRETGLVFQDLQLLNYLSARENVPGRPTNPICGGRVPAGSGDGRVCGKIDLHRRARSAYRTAQPGNSRHAHRRPRSSRAGRLVHRETRRRAPSSATGLPGPMSPIRRKSRPAIGAVDCSTPPQQHLETPDDSTTTLR